MSNKILVVVDMQNDFITGPLGTPEAREIVPKMADYIRERAAAGDTIWFTRDTHFDNYLYTAEGKKLPVEHCIHHTDGWQIASELIDAYEEGTGHRNLLTFDKITFGSTELIENLEWSVIYGAIGPDVEIEFCGVCTDICVVSNVLMTKAYLPEAKISVIEHLCAGVTPAAHIHAIETMKSCHIDII